MSRVKGDGKGRLGGRTKGTPNKVTSDLRQWVSNLIDKNRAQAMRDIKALEPKDRLMIMERLLSYVLPKMQSIDASFSFDQLTEEQLDRVISKKEIKDGD